MTQAEIITRFMEAVKPQKLIYTTAAQWEPLLIQWLRGIAEHGYVNWGSSSQYLRQYALNYDMSRAEFAELFNAYVATTVWKARREVDKYAQVEICTRCKHLTWSLDQRNVRDSLEGERHSVCRACAESYYVPCTYCGTAWLNGSVVFVPTREGNHCPECWESVRAAYEECEQCHRWYSLRRAGYVYSYDDDGEPVERGGHRICITCRPADKSRCRPRTPEFDFPVLCLGPQVKIHSGEIKEITIGGGDVATTGLQTIHDLIASKTRGKTNSGIYLTQLLEPSFDADWITKEGNLPKRLAKILLVENNLKLTEDLMAEIGNIAKSYTTKPSVQRIRLDRIIGHDRTQYVNDNSCWWTDYWYSRCTLKSLGGMSIRCYDESGKQAMARGWLIPLKQNLDPLTKRDWKWVPSPDLSQAEGYVVFNVYDRNGRLEAVHFGRMIAQMTGKSYKKMPLVVDRMYVNGTDRNGRAGYSGSVLVAEQSLCEGTARVTIPERLIPNRCECR